MGCKRKPLEVVVLSNKQCRRLSVEVHPDLLPSGVTRDGIVAFIEKCGFRIARENLRETVIHVIAVREGIAGANPLGDSGRQ